MLSNFRPIDFLEMNKKKARSTIYNQKYKLKKIPMINTKHVTFPNNKLRTKIGNKD